MHGLRGHLSRYFGSAAMAAVVAVCFAASGCGDDDAVAPGASDDGGVLDGASN
ncbi:MAG: hypothetical protein K0S65_6207, partial [Labilithrix sp.]|nr:hypothetical protein [Labilithrix sp.]